MIRILALALISAALPVWAGAPLERHFGAADSCYQRIYSDDHLARHPQQKVAAMRLDHFPGDQAYLGLGGSWHSYPDTPALALRLSVWLRGREMWRTVAVCAPEGARIRCGLECDAGSFFVQDRDAGSVLITGGGDLWFTDCDVGDRVLIRQPDDLSFLLRRLPDAACAP